MAAAHTNPVSALAADATIGLLVGTEGALVAYRIYLEINSVQSEVDLKSAANVLRDELTSQATDKLLGVLGRGAVGFHKNYKVGVKVNANKIGSNLGNVDVKVTKRTKKPATPAQEIALPAETPAKSLDASAKTAENLALEAGNVGPAARIASQCNSNYALFNKTHANPQPVPKGLGPNGGRLQSHHGLQQEWAVNNLPGYDPKLAPTVTIETGKGFPHTTLSNLQNARRIARVAAGHGKWSSSIDEELRFIVSDFRQAGFSNDVIRQVLEQNYRMLDKLNVKYIKPAEF